ncbi:MAG: DNA polymerase III subunit delta' [Tissierellia bacterium]|nr:DNA polymerase III subunit delta' [Tissierellia bacterium]
MDFSNIYGHEKTIKALKRIIEKDNVFHTYLFVGEEAIGKRLVALTFAKTLLCKQSSTEPCNSCISCLKFDSFNHPDLELIEPEKGLIKKEVIDKLIKSMSISPLESRRKIIIIDDCHLMGMEAQNALLKTLEEPPSYVNILLITSNTKNLIPTIISRAQVIKFNPVENEKIVDLLVSKYGKDKGEASFIAHFTKGSIGKSIDLCKSQDFFDLRQSTLDHVHSIIKGDRLNIFNSIDFFIENKDQINEIMDIILFWFRDLLIFKETGNLDLILNRDKIQLLSSETFLDIEKINGIIDNIMDTKRIIEHNVNFQLAIETMLLNMQEVNSDGDSSRCKI